MAREIRKSRQIETRGEEWAEPSILDHPPAPEGYGTRWIRVTLGGKPDLKNIRERKAEGWEFVTLDEIKSWEGGKAYEAPTLDHGVMDGYVGVGDVALAKAPLELIAKRTRRMQAKSAAQSQAIDLQLGKLQDKRMPIYNESKSVVLGGRNATFDD